jgi:tetratricopeptide (TPR) repeat protein
MPENIPFINESLAQARAMEKSGKFTQAEHVYRAVLDRYPTNELVKTRLKSVQKIIAGQAQTTAVSPSLQGGINVLVNLYKQGRLPEALNQGAVLSGRFPGDPTIHNILGAINARIGQADVALACYDRALDIKPDFAEVHNNRGNVLNRLGRHAEAIASFRKALQIKPEYAEAHNNMGVALYDTGQFAEAAASYRKALKVRPAYAEAHNNLGNALRDLDEPEEALSSFVAALRIAPGHAQTHKNLGDVLRSLGKLDQAIGCFEKAIQIRSNYPEPYLGLGLILNDLGRHHQAIENIRTAIQLQPLLAEAHSSLGNALGNAGLYDEAMSSYRAAVKIKPDFAEAHCSLGIALSEVGRFEEAIASFTVALQLRPDLAEASVNLSRIKKYCSDDPHIEKMLERMEKPDLIDHERMHLSFALGKVYEDLGDVDRSFKYLLDGNRIKKMSTGYDINADKTEFRKIRSLFKADSSLAIPKETVFARQPVFIVGMPRSGTTLVEQILASHSQVFGGGELEDLGRILGPVVHESIATGKEQINAEMIVGYRSAYLRALAARPGVTPFITDKMPTNFKWVGFLLTAMPGVKIINVQRDPVATCWSMFKVQFRGSGYTNDLVDIAEFYKLYLDLMDFWREEYPGQVYDLDYEMLTNCQEQETRKLLAYCGLDWEEQCLEFYKTERAVRTLSDGQIRQKMYTGSSDAWRKYEAHLSPLIEAMNSQK